MDENEQMCTSRTVFWQVRIGSLEWACVDDRRMVERWNSDASARWGQRI